MDNRDYWNKIGMLPSDNSQLENVISYQRNNVWE